MSIPTLLKITPSSLPAKKLIVNDKYIPLIDNQSRFLLLYGGSGSGKSKFAAFKKIKRVLSERGHKILALRKIATTVKDSIYAEIHEAITDHEVIHEFQINKTEHSFTHVPTGNQIICKGLDDAAKIKSIKGITSVWMEEATEFEEDEFDQLDLRIRGQKENYVQYILSFNPIDENHWLKKRFFDKKDPSATVCHSNYQDNYFLTAEDVQRLHALKDRNELMYDVYCLGKWGIVVKSNKFFYSFGNEKHIIESYEPNPHLPITISMDFNVVPMTSIVSQKLTEMRSVVFDELKVEEGSTEEMCELIKAKYVKWMYNMEVTGDATGYNREKAKRGNINSYMVIKEELALKDYQIKVRSKNPENKDARVLCNSVLQHAQFQITKNCKELINDAVYTAIKVKEGGKIEIIKTEEDGRHYADTLKYIIDCFYPDFITNPKKYR